MIRNQLSRIRLYLLSLYKSANRIFDMFRPRGFVEATLTYAYGPKKGQVHSVHSGENIVTGWLSDVAPTSGRDIMRRLLIPPSFSSTSLSGVTDVWVGQMALGSGATAETSGDVGIEVQMSPPALSAVSGVTLDALNPYVTFLCNFSESEANGPISEAVLLSGVGRNDVLARKTFTQFTKTPEFTLQLRWQLRF